jgi:hypothetical protein
MKIICPKCGLSQEADRNDLMGRYVVCRKCKSVFSWIKNLYDKARCKMFPTFIETRVKKKRSLCKRD